jgi:hypothetical protein
MRPLQAHVSSGERGVHDDRNVNTPYAFTQDQPRPRASDATQGIDLPETPQQRLGRQRRGRKRERYINRASNRKQNRKNGDGSYKLRLQNAHDGKCNCRNVHNQAQSNGVSRFRYMTAQGDELPV